jgi:chemosensory pili system protein ChpA (sensor histidine kinase/response regulator)
LIAHELETAIHAANDIETPFAAVVDTPMYVVEVEPAPIESVADASATDKYEPKHEAKSFDLSLALAASSAIAGAGFVSAWAASPAAEAPKATPIVTAFVPVIAAPVAEPIAERVAVVSPIAAAKPETAPQVLAPSVPSASFPAAAAQTSARSVDALAGIRDDLELTVLPIFLEEAQELFPEASAQVRQWRDSPTDVAAKNGLKRTMHTLKGSARMAGAMRVGEIAHQLETRLEEDERKLVVSPQLFEELEIDLDHIAFLLDKLERGEANTPLPGMNPVVESAPQVELAALENALDAMDEDEAFAEQTEQASPAPVVALPSTPQISMVSAAAMAAATTATVATVATTTASATIPAAPFVNTNAPTDTPQTIQALLDGDQAGQAQVLRVRSDAVERLADETGEMSISRSRAETELKALRGNLNELTSSVVRLRTQVREIEIQAETQIQSRLTQVQDESSTFDPLEFDRFTRFQELTRSLAEGVNDVQTVQQSFVSSLDAADSALNSQARIARSLQSQLQSIRTVPFASLRERLYRTLRQTARDLNKRANMEIRGGELSIDRSVLERLAPLVEHVLRNALAHGIEMPADRVAKGKSETGEISIELRQQGNLVELTLSDDGRGFDVAAIRRKAVAQGLANDDQTLTDQQWIDHIFLPGFTTASEVTAVAGRGVGMDVVRTEIGALGGRVELRLEQNAGAKFVLFVPLTLTLLNVVMVKIGAHRYGFPAAMVEAVKNVKRSEFALAQAYGVLQHGREKITFVSIHPWLGEVPALREDSGDQVLVIRSGNRVLALNVDSVQGNQEVVLKRMGPQLSRVQGLVGVTLLGDGDIVLLFDPIQLVAGSADVQAAQTDDAEIVAKTVETAPQVSTEIAAAGSETVARAPVAVEPVAIAQKSALRVVPNSGVVLPFRPIAQAEKPLVLVVDDSLTVRKITTRFLEREGFRALSAKDGMDALSVLSENKPAVILLDIEMPRMDGFEFTRAAKGDAALKDIPIIMITSRTAENTATTRWNWA